LSIAITSLFGLSSCVHFVTNMGRSRSFAVLSSEALISGVRESSLGLSLHGLVGSHLVVIIVELVLHGSVLLRVMRILDATVHLAVRLLVPRELVGVNH
jgi:hypothetical protein